MLDPKGTLTYAFAPRTSEVVEPMKRESSLVGRPANPAWRYVARRRYLKDQMINGIVLGVLFLILGWLGILFRFAGNLVANSTGLFGGLLMGLLVGPVLGRWSWQRQVPGIERPVPKVSREGLSWVAWFLFFIIVPPLLAQVFGSMLSDPNSSALAGFLLWALIATITLGWAIRVASILRYERLNRTKLVAVRSGPSRFDIREVQILKSPRAAFTPS